MVEVSLFSTWLTPTSLFILLNIVIATILFVSSTTTTNHPSRGGSADPSPSPLPPHPQPHLARPPSFLSRVMSFNYSPVHYVPEPEPEPEHLLSRAVQPDPPGTVTVTRAPSFLSRVMPFNSSRHTQDGPEPEPEPEHPMSRPVEVAGAPSLLSRVASFSLQGLNRGVQSPQGTAEEGKRTEENEPRESRGPEKKKTKKKKQQPVAAPRGGREGGVGGKETTSLKSRDEEVDAKADDFINKFKQQLKLQRLESLLRYRNSA